MRSYASPFPCPIIAKRSPHWRTRRRRPLLARRQGGGLIFLSGQTPIDPDTGTLVEGDIGAQTRRCLDNLAIVAAAAGASLDDAVRCGIYVTDISTFKDGQRGLRRLLRRRAAGAQHDRRRGAAARRRRRDRRDPCRPRLSTSRRRGRGREGRPPHAGALDAHDLRARRRHGRAEGGEPPAHRLVQGPRRVGEARRAGGGGLRERRRRRLGRQPRAGARRRGGPRGVRCEVFVPADAPIAKAEAARGQGAIVHIGGDVARGVPRGRAGAGARRRPRVRAPVRRPGESSPGRGRWARAARGRPRSRARGGAGRRRRAGLRRRHRGQVRRGRRSR